jgi:hypothetical protein
MIYLFILEEIYETYNCFRREKWFCTYLKKMNKSDVLEVVMSEAVRAVQEREEAFFP